MATVYSLICFGGKDGKTVTFTDAGDVVNLTNHGLRDGTGVVFTDNSGNTLPTGLSKYPTTIYYARSTGANTFTLHTSPAGAIANTGQVTFTGTGSGTHKVKSAYYVGLSDKSRWTVGVIEQVFDGVISWNTGRANASSLDVEVAEIGMSWKEISGSVFACSIPSAERWIVSSIDGVRTDAFHNGNVSTGYEYVCSSTSGTAFGSVHLLDGIQITSTHNTSATAVSQGAVVKNNILYCDYAASTATGCVAVSVLGKFINNIVINYNTGLVIQQYQYQCLVANNIFKCKAYGVYASGGVTSNIFGAFYNNICVGATANWFTPASTIGPCSGNTGQAADSTQPWTTTGGYHLDVETTDFADYAGLNFRPAAVTSPQVEVGVSFYGAAASDIQDYAVPAYSGSGYGTAASAGSFGAGLTYTVATVGTTDFTACGASSYSVTFTDTGDTVNCTAHPFSNGSVIYFSSITTTTGIATDTIYYVVAATVNAFKVAATLGGDALALTTNGSGIAVKAQFKATSAGSGTGTATQNAVLDCGCYEYDLGYGSWPTTQPVSLTGLIDGSRVKIATQSDGTELYNAVLSGATSVSYTEDMSTDTAVYVYVRKGSSATYYHPIKLSATIDSETGLSLSASGLQIEDIAAHDYSATAVATDWSFNLSTGAITHDSGTTRYSVQDLYSWHQDYTDDSLTVDDNPLMHGTTPTMFELINSGSISDADLQDLYGGSIEFGDGTLWSNVYSVGTLTGTPDVYIYQGANPITQHWASGHVDILVKAIDAGTPVSSGLITGYARKWGYSYDHYEVDLSAGGRNVMPLSTFTDPAITDTTTTVSGWTDITATFGTYSRDFGDVHGAQTYYCEIDCNNRPLAEVYQYLQYLCRENASGTLNGVAAETYQKAHSSATAIKTAPFGTFSGGFFTTAPMVWLKNVASAEDYLYSVSDAAGNTHQNDPPANGLTITSLVAGSTVRVFETGTTTVIDSTTNSGTSFVVTGISGDVDYTIQKDGYIPIRVVGQAVSGATVVAGTQTVDRAFQA